MLVYQRVVTIAYSYIPQKKSWFVDPPFSPSLQLGQCQVWEALLQKVSLVFVLLLAQPEFESPEAAGCCWMLLDA